MLCHRNVYERRQSSFLTAGDPDVHTEFLMAGVSSARFVCTNVKFMYQLMFHYSYAPETDVLSSGCQQDSPDRGECGNTFDIDRCQRSTVHINSG